MKSASVNEIKAELSELPHKELVGIVQRLARFKKENKELLTWILFESHDLEGYLSSVREEMLAAMLDIRSSQGYLAKKTIRKTLRLTLKHIRLSGSRQAEAELLSHFLQLVLDSKVDLSRNTVIQNICRTQIRKIQTAITALHEDLQYEYQKMLDELAAKMPFTL